MLRARLDVLEQNGGYVIQSDGSKFRSHDSSIRLLREYTRLQEETDLEPMLFSRNNEQI